MEDAFVLPDGSSLRYALPGDRGGQFDWYRTFRAAYLETWRAKIKEKRIRLGLWNSQGEVSAVAADFDRLPPGYANFDKLEEYIEATFRGKALITRSPSGRVKCFIAVRQPGSLMTAAIARDTLEVIFGDLACGLDISLPALSITFLTREMVQQLRGLRDLPVIEPILESEEFEIKEDVNKDITPLHLFRTFRGELPEQLRDWVNESLLREAFVRILYESPRLLSPQGMDLPSTKLATQCEARPVTIRRYITAMVNDGLLACKSERYLPSKKAMTYRAMGWFADLLEARFPTRKHTERASMLLEGISDGEWNKRIFEMCMKWPGSLEEFATFAYSLPGIELKDRRRKVRNAIAQRRRYEARRRRA